MIPEFFTTDKYDNRIAVTDGVHNFTILDLKRLIASEMEFLKDKKENIVIIAGDNFSFIIQFFASLFCDKSIYLITDKTRLNCINFEYDLLEDYVKQPTENPKFKNIDIRQPKINFYTSGSSGTPKIIKKSLHNLICEAEDIGKEFGFHEKNLTVVSTTTMCHLLGLTFHLMIPLCNGLIINTKNIAYPENIDKNNIILVSTPTFLNTIPKFDMPFKVPPEYIISAGSKLNEKTFEFLEKKSDIIEIYGSTETGVMAHKTSSNNDFELFGNVNIKAHNDKIEVISDYFPEDMVILNDEIELNGRFLKIKNRTDRLLKIYEKRVSAEELETALKKHPFVDNCYIDKYKEKPVCLCALSEYGQDYLLKNSITDLTKTLKTHLKTHSEIVPQKWKYIDEIPMTISGKINRNLIKHIFSINISLPIILKRALSENAIDYKIYFYKQCNFFNGHFPELKLVPGVMQLYLAKEFANIHFNLSLGEGQWKRIKFSNIIESDSIVHLKLERNDKRVTYEFYTDTKKYSSGVFLCENIFKGVL